MEYLCFECTWGGGEDRSSCPAPRDFGDTTHARCRIGGCRSQQMQALLGSHRAQPTTCATIPPPHLSYIGVWDAREWRWESKSGGAWQDCGGEKKNGLPTPPHPPCSRRTVGPLAQPSTPPPPCHPLKKWRAKSKTIAKPALSPLPLTSFPRREKGRRRSVEQRWSPWDGVATGVDGGRRRRVGVANSSQVWGRALSGKRLWR